MERKMNDFKSKLPDLKELGAITGKLFKDLKTSVEENIDDYKKKREGDENKPKPARAKTETTVKEASIKPAKPKGAKPAAAKATKAKPQKTAAGKTEK